MCVFGCNWVHSSGRLRVHWEGCAAQLTLQFDSWSSSRVVSHSLGVGWPSLRAAAPLHQTTSFWGAWRSSAGSGNNQTVKNSNSLDLFRWKLLCTNILMKTHCNFQKQNRLQQKEMSYKSKLLLFWCKISKYFTWSLYT